MSNDRPIKIEAWLNELSLDVDGLFHKLRLFKFTREIMTINQFHKKYDLTYVSWIMDSATVDMVISIGRFCDRESDALSMVQFLRKFKQESKYHQRSRFIDMFQKIGLDKDMACSLFDKLSDGSRIFPVKRIDSDIQLLTGEEPCKRIMKFRHEYLAHTSKKPKLTKPTYDDLDGAFCAIKEVVERYEALVFGRSPQMRTPVIQGNWQEVLTTAWCPKGGLPWFFDEDAIGNNKSNVKS